jgi:hypothetical protein
MVYDEKMTDLEETRRLLVLQADVHRSTLQLELASLKERLGWLGGARQAAKNTRPWLIGAAAVLGFLAMRYQGGVTRWLPVVLATWRIGRRFLRH